jgi:hypothetical protein
LGDRALAIGWVAGCSSSSLFGSVGDFLPTDIGVVPWLFAIETLIVFHEFCTFLGIVSLPRANFICNDGVYVHGISSLGSSVVSSFFMALVLFYPKGLVESSTCIWMVGSSLAPLAMLFLSFLCLFFECPGSQRVIGIGRDDGVKKSSFEP